jgi:hypothetical protein
MPLWNWLRPTDSRSKQKAAIRWLAPSENRWGLQVLDCTQFASTMMSFTSDVEIAKKYESLRSYTGEDLPSQGAGFFLGVVEAEVGMVADARGAATAAI